MVADPRPARYRQLPLQLHLPPVVLMAPTSCQNTHQQQVPQPLEPVVAWHVCRQLQPWMGQLLRLLSVEPRM